MNKYLTARLLHVISAAITFDNSGCLILGVQIKDDIIIKL